MDQFYDIFWCFLGHFFEVPRKKITGILPSPKWWTCSMKSWHSQMFWESRHIKAHVAGSLSCWCHTSTSLVPGSGCSL